ncbi:MAG: hydrogenase maturation nickel metallochaperone HypA [Bacteroidota bacterium]
MHEISLTRTIIRSVQQELSPDELDRLRGIRLKVGVLSGVEPVLLENAFEVVTENSPFKGVSLEIESVPVEVECHLCGTHFQVQKQKFICPNCHNPTNNIKQGDELTIHQVMLDDE